MLSLTLVLVYGPCDRRHFQNMMARYGEPILVLDLVKKKEKKAREVGCWAIGGLSPCTARDARVPTGRRRSLAANWRTKSST